VDRSVGPSTICALKYNEIAKAKNLPLGVGLYCDDKPMAPRMFLKPN
jgi:hypothetical protein